MKIEDLAKKIETGEIKTTKWEDTLAPMVEWCAGFTGKSPRVQARVSQRGRRKGDRTKASYSLRLLIWQLALSVERGHGKLTLNRTNKSGTWIDALNDLRPLFPGIIPSALPLPMIEKLKAEAKKGALTG